MIKVYNTELQTFLSFNMRSYDVGGGRQYISWGLMKVTLVMSQCHGGCASAKDKLFRVGFLFYSSLFKCFEKIQD
jgi:hypothetical protein